MLLGSPSCRLSVVTSAHVTWKPVIGWWGWGRDTLQRKWAVTLSPWKVKAAVRFTGLAKTFDGAGEKKQKMKSVWKLWWDVLSCDLVFLFQKSCFVRWCPNTEEFDSLVSPGQMMGFGLLLWIVAQDGVMKVMLSSLERLLPFSVRTVTLYLQENSRCGRLM